MTTQTGNAEIKRVFTNIFPQLQKPKRWRKDFNTKEEVLRAAKKGNPYAKRIVDAALLKVSQM